MTTNLADRLPADGDPDAVLAAYEEWARERGIELYDHQQEAVLELLGGSNVILATPTGSGKSLVASGAIAGALAADRVSFYTAPIKALVNEKFFDLCAQFGAGNVGMLTGDSAVNADAPIICCTAEVLANLALREGRGADVGLVVMDEFHFYGEPDRGWAWQVPLLELVDAQFLLMSATLGEVGELRADLTRRTGRETALVDSAERPVPLTFSYVLTPLAETVEDLIRTGQTPAYVVHFTQAAALEHARTLAASTVASREQRDLILEAIGGFGFAAGFGRTLSKLLRAGVGVHHSGMLPRYRRLVEQLAQRGLLPVICGTDTLGVGINVPIRTVLFTGLAKFDGSRSRVLRTREFQQIAGRAGRAGYDTAGSVVVQAPEHVIENERALAKAGDDPKKRRKVQRKKPAEGTPVWDQATFDRLVSGAPETLVPRMKVDNAMLINVLSRPEDAFVALRRLLGDNHLDRKSQLRLFRRALRLARSLVRSALVVRLDEPDELGRRYVLPHGLPADFALNQPLSHFALAAMELIDLDDPDHAVEVVSVLESVLESPRQILFAQQRAARGEAIARMKADGIEYEERMRLLEEITWPQPRAEQLRAAYEVYRQGHPWLPEDAVEPKAIVREMFEQAMGFADFVRRYDLARSEGLVLRYLTDAYRALRHSVAEDVRTEQVEELTEWLGAVVRQVDSSLLDEWAALEDPDRAASGAGDGSREAANAPVPLSAQQRVLQVMIRNAMFLKVTHVAFDRVDALAALETAAIAQAAEADELAETAESPSRQPVMRRTDWDDALEEYFGTHDDVLTDADARAAHHLHVEPFRGPATGDPDSPDRRLLRVRQTLVDPDGDRDWVIDAEVDLDATDALGQLVLVTTRMHRWDG